MTELKTLVDHASTQSDRWLFIALMLIGIGAIWLLVKYFTQQIAILASKHDELNKFVRDEHSHLVTRCTDALNANTRVIERMQRRASDDDEVDARTPDSQRR